VAKSRATTHRLGSFSNGMFTVAMTIMVFQLKPPEYPKFAALLELWPTGLSYVVSYWFIVWINYHHLLRLFPHVTPRLIWINFVHLFTVSLVPFSTAWVARTQLATVPVFVHAAVFVLVNLAYIPFEWDALAFAVKGDISRRTRRFAKTRSSLTLGIFIAAMLLSLKSPWLVFELICCALLRNARLRNGHD
jgi:uncharacterized membrane protein